MFARCQLLHSHLACSSLSGHIHPTREQPDGAADLLNTNSHSQYYSLQRSFIKLVRPLSTVDTLATLVYPTGDSGLTIT